MLGRKNRKNMRGGYAKALLLLNSLFNITLSTIFILSSLPLVIIISLVIKLENNGPVFYSGDRYGLDKKLFKMYKFRTLKSTASKLIGAELLTARISLRHKLLTSSGSFLRDTRLDELPQLYNVLKGDMDFVGPRPIRPEIYEKYGKHIRDFDERFKIKPGLIGYSQLFTPHGAPKKIRSLIDNKFTKRRQNFLWDTCMIVFTMLVVIRSTFVEASKSISSKLLKMLKFQNYEEKRIHQRVNLRGAELYIGEKISEDKNLIGKNGSVVSIVDEKVFSGAFEADLVDINDEALLINSNYKLDKKEFALKIEIEHKKKFSSKVKKKTAVCIGKVYYELETIDTKYKYVIKFRPVSPLNYYLVQQYFLHQSIV